MKKLIILLLISPFSYSQEKEVNLSLLGGYEYSSPNSTGWNVLFTAVSPSERIPRLEIGFSLSYGISEYNRPQGYHEIDPTSSDFTQVDVSTPVPLSRLHYAWHERFRMGIEAQYAVINRERSKLYLGTGVSLEILRSNREFGYMVYQEVDSTGFKYTEEPYWVNERGEDIDPRTMILVQPFAAYQFGLSERLFLHVRAMGNISLQDIAYPRPGPQVNLGVMYRL